MRSLLKSKKTILALILSLGVLTVVLWNLVLPSTPVAPPSQSLATLRAGNSKQQEIVATIKTGQWAQVETYLKAAGTEETTVIQLLRYVEKGGLTAKDRMALFPMVFTYVENPELQPRHRVLAFRIFSNLDLSKKEQAQIRRYFESASHKRFKEDLLGHSFVGSIPFPKDLQNQLLTELKSGKSSRCTEDIFIISSLKDANAKNSLSSELMGAFSKIHDSCKPVVAKFLENHASNDLRAKKSYKAIDNYLAKQKVDL